MRGAARDEQQRGSRIAWQDHAGVVGRLKEAGEGGDSGAAVGTGDDGTTVATTAWLWWLWP